MLPKLFKKITHRLPLLLVLLFTGSLIFLSHPPPAQAGLLEFAGKIKDTYDALQVCKEDGYNFVECLVHDVQDVALDIGISTLADSEVADDPLDLSSSTFSPTKGLIPNSITAVSSLYSHPPANTPQYIAFVRHQISPQPAYAQDGIGYQGLDPLIKVWSAFRNIAYFLFVIVFIVMGFMIMFRTKIDPQTIINIQTALPRLILTLILITFSYAIAGFLIDLMYFLIYFIIAIFGQAGLIDSEETRTIIGEKHIIKIYFQDIFSVFEEAGSTIFQRFYLAAAHVVGSLLGFLAQEITKAVLPKVAALFVLGTMFFLIIKTFIILLTSFITAIIYVIFAPIFLMFNALPGSNAFQNWLKNILANILVFPGVALFIILAAVLTGASNFGASPVSSYEAFTPPLLNFKYSNVSAIQSIVGFGMILLLPSVAQMIKDAFKVEPFKYGKDMGAAVAAGFAPLKYLINQGQQRKEKQEQEQMLQRALSAREG